MSLTFDQFDRLAVEYAKLGHETQEVIRDLYEGKDPMELSPHLLRRARRWLARAECKVDNANKMRRAAARSIIWEEVA